MSRHFVMALIASCSLVPGAMAATPLGFICNFTRSVSAQGTSDVVDIQWARADRLADGVTPAYAYALNIPVLLPGKYGTKHIQPDSVTNLRLEKFYPPRSYRPASSYEIWLTTTSGRVLRSRAQYNACRQISFE